MQRNPDSQDARDAATVLPIVTIILLMPPVILIFAVPAMLAGIPLIVVFIFGVWGAAIAAALLLARRLRRFPVVSAAEPPPEGD